MDAQYALGALACFHVRPELAEMEMKPPLAATASLVPSDDETIDPQCPLGPLVCVHVRPESVEV